MTARRWIAAALAILLTAALGIALLKHKTRSSTTRRVETTGYRPWKKRKLEFNKQVAPIVYSNCAKCHYPGSAAPFALTSYREVRNHAPAIGRALDRGLMPPWKPERGFGEFLGDNSLTDQEKGMIKQWLAEGCREGNPSKRPVPPKPPPQWFLGPPDDILEMTESYKIPGEGKDIYRCFIIPTHYAEDRYVRAVDIVPGNPRVVHHIINYVDTSGGGRAREAAEGGVGFDAFGALGFPIAGQLGGWAPGSASHPLNDGVGYFLPKGADDITVLQILPHMHLMGREIAGSAILPDGSFVPIVQINDWDFRWQNFYTLKTPLHLPAGSRVRLEARYDNSSSNPRNPNNPPKLVKFGVGTKDEMCVIWLFYTVDSERLTLNTPAPSTYLDSWTFAWGRLSAGRK